MSTEMQETAPDTQAEEDFGWSLGVLLRTYQSAMSEVLTDLPHGHRGYQILSAVAQGDQGSQLALAAHLGIDRSVMTYLIDDLVEAELVERQPNPADRRQRKIVATDAGIRALAELDRRVQTAQDSVLAPLDPGERETLCRLVRRVASGVRASGTPAAPCELPDGVLNRSTR